MEPFGTQPSAAAAATTEHSFDSQRSVLELAVEACSAVLEAAGLSAADLDGMARYSAHGDSSPPRPRQRPSASRS